MLVGLKSEKSGFFPLQQASFVSSVNIYTKQVLFASNLSSSGARMHKLAQKHAQTHIHTHTHMYTHTQTHFIVYSSLRPCQTKRLVADFPLGICRS